MSRISDATNLYRTAGATYARDAWDTMHRHGASAWQRTRTFVGAHPAVVQGVYFVLTGLWPVLALDSFLKVTGHRADYWLSQKMGLLLVVLGATLCLAAYRRAKSPEVLLLAVASATVLAGADLLFFFAGTLSWVYLIDAAVQLIILALWLHNWYVENVLTRPSAAAPAAAASSAPPSGAVPTAASHAASAAAPAIGYPATVAGNSQRPLSGAPQAPR
jgi:hypothetical protein